MSAQNPADYQNHPANQQFNSEQEDEIDLRELIGILWAEKWLVIGITGLAAILSVVYALMQVNVYRAEAVLAPAEEQQGNSGLGSQLGGAAALLGVNVGAGGGDRVTTALAVLNSREFIGKFINEHALVVPLFAGVWDKVFEASQIDPAIYNEALDQWMKVDTEPTQLEATRAFKKILSISGPDRETGIVTIAIDWHDPVLASKWVNGLIADINRDLRIRDVNEANNAITYLRNQLESTPLVEMQRVFYQLIESQTRITMLADVREEYVFRVIDPAVVPDQKIAPRRAMICILGVMLGGMFSLLLIIVRRYFFTDKSKKL